MIYGPIHVRCASFFACFLLSPLSGISGWWIWGSSLSQNTYWFPYSGFPFSSAKCFNQMFSGFVSLVFVSSEHFGDVTEEPRTMGTGSLSRGESDGVWRWPPTPTNAEVKERVKLYFYSPSGLLWPLLCWTLRYFTLLCWAFNNLKLKTFINIINIYLVKSQIFSK